LIRHAGPVPAHTDPIRSLQRGVVGRRGRPENAADGVRRLTCLLGRAQLPIGDYITADFALEPMRDEDG
jgi:hypothetical protein